MASTTKGSIGEAQVGGEPFSLIDHTNSVITQDRFQGKLTLMYFGFTNCPDICPDELDKMVQVVDSLDSQPTLAKKTIPVFVTVDPKRDSPEVLSSYLKGIVIGGYL